jgi:hypothetical protein
MCAGTANTDVCKHHQTLNANHVGMQRVGVHGNRGINRARKEEQAQQEALCILQDRERASTQASKQASEQASKQGRKEGRKQAAASDKQQIQQQAARPATRGSANN